MSIRKLMIFVSLALGVAMLIASAPAQARTVTHCGAGIDFQSAQVIENTTINSDLLVDHGYCNIVGVDTEVNGNIRVLPGAHLLLVDAPTVTGNVTAHGGTFDGHVAYVGGNVNVVDSPGGTSLIFTDVGGNVTLRNIHGGIFFLGWCGPPQFGNCVPGEPSDTPYQFSIGGNLTIMNVTGPFHPAESLPDNVFNTYAIGGDVTLRNIAGGGEMTDNIIGGNLTCSRVFELNTWTVSGNSVAGGDTCSPAESRKSGRRCRKAVRHRVSANRTKSCHVYRRGSGFGSA